MRARLARCWPFAAIFLLALGVRIVYLLQIRSIPFFTAPVGDAAGYDAWGQRLAGGDWMGTDAFYQAPAYPYFLGAVYRLMGREMFTIRLVQAGLGALSCVFLGLAGQRFFSNSVGVGAAFLLALYPPAIFFDGLLQKTSLGLLLMSALLWSLAAVQEHPGARRFFVVGVLLGLLGLTRENALVLAAIVLGWVWLGFAPCKARPRLRWTGGLAAGLLFTFGPVAWRNHHVGGPWAITTVQAGPNFYVGNNADATGRYTPLVRGHESPPFEREDAKRLAEQATGVALTDKQVSRYWLGRSWEFIHSDPVSWLVLLGKKLLLVVNAYEITDTEGYNVYRDYAPLLRAVASILHFGVICPLAAAGVLLTWHDRRRLGVLYAVILALAGSVAVFYVFARYRFPLVPLATLFASAGLVQGARYIREGKRKELLVPAAALVVAALVCNLPLNPERQLDAMAYGNLGGVLARRGEVAAAVPFFQIALENNPEAAEAHYNLGLAQRVLANCANALEHLLAAKRLDPTLIEVDYQLGVAYECVGDHDSALEHYRAALKTNPADTEAATAIARLTGE